MTRLLALLTAALLVLSSCGLPQDDAPRTVALDAIPQELRPGQLPTPTPETPQADGDLGDQQIHMIGVGNRLETVVREIVETPEDLLQLLLDGTSPEERRLGITSAFSSRLSNVRIAEFNPVSGLVTVDLADGSLGVQNSEQKLGFAQIVFTLTSLPEISSVDFIETDPNDPTNPRALAVQTDRGSLLPGDAVSRADFPLLDPQLNARPSFDIPIDDEPEETSGLPITVWEIRDVLRDSQGAELGVEPEDFAASGAVFGQQLVGVVRFIPTLSPEAIIASLFSGTQQSDQSRGLRSALPPDALANSVAILPFNIGDSDDNGFATIELIQIAQVDLAPGSLPNENDGDERLLATAQIVFTLTASDAIDAVVFSIDGVQLGMPTDNGLSQPFDPANPVGLTRTDYALLAPGGFIWQDALAPIPASVPSPTPVPAAQPATEPEPTPGG